MIYINFKKLSNAVLLFTAFYFLHGCYPKGPEFYSDLDLTATNYDPDYDFANQEYFWMADTVRYITNVEDDEIDPDDEAALLQKVETKLEDLNYKRVGLGSPDSAEFVITINVISTRSSGIGWIPGPPCYPGWWGCYPGYYPPWWGGYYSYSYSTGSVIINWYDPQESPVVLDSEEQQPIHWTAAFNGLISSSEQNNSARINASIDQAFDQSPYLGSNK